MQRKMQSDCNLWCIVLIEDNATCVKSKRDIKKKSVTNVGIPYVGKGHGD